MAGWYIWATKPGIPTLGCLHSICWYSDQFDITHLGWKPRRHSLLILLQVISHGCCCYASKTLGHMHRSCTVERQHFTSMGIWIVLSAHRDFFLDSDYWISTTLPHEDRTSSTDLATLFGKQNGLETTRFDSKYEHRRVVWNFLQEVFFTLQPLHHSCQEKITTLASTVHLNHVNPPKKGLCAARWRGLRPSARGLLLDWPSTAWHRAPWIQKIVDGLCGSLV